MTSPPASPGRRPPRKQTPRSARRTADEGYAAAEQIQRQRPQWMIIYGCYSHRYWAYALFPMNPRVIVHASYPGALIGHLDRAEQAYRIHPPQEPPAP